MNLTQDAIDLIKHFEGYYSKAYKCPANIPTIGIGTIRYPNGAPVQLGDTCTEEQAEAWLRDELGECEKYIQKLVTAPINDEQYSALACLIYNIGAGGFSHSTLLKKLNYQKYEEAADQFLAWVKANGKTLPGLERRRRAERNLFIGKDWKEYKA